MRRLFAPLFLAAATAALACPAQADDDGATMALRKLAAASSYHATIAAAGKPQGTVQLDFVAPDRFRMQTPAGTQYVVGDTLYITMQGKTSRMTMPHGMLVKFRDPANLARLQSESTVTPLGAGLLDGKPAQKYRIVSAKSPDTTSVLWVDAGGWPLQVDVDGKQGRATVRYSRFNDPAIRVDPPN